MNDEDDKFLWEGRDVEAILFGFGENGANYSDLENLHVYGNLLTLYTLPVKVTIAEAGRIYDTLKMLDLRIFSLYVAYILSKSGYYSSEYGADENGEIKLKTTEFTDEDWLEFANDLLFWNAWIQPWIQPDIWSMEFENGKKECLSIFFVTAIYDPMKIPAEFKLGSSFFVVHPRLFRTAREACERFNEKLKAETGSDLVFSTGQFVVKFISDTEKRQINEKNWEFLIAKILAKFQTEWKILVYSVHQKEIEESRNELQKARLKLESGIDLAEAVLSAGIACEGLLSALYSTKPKRIKEKMTFDEYLSDLTDLLTEEFGEDILWDLKLIREWRNKVAHAPRSVPDAKTALKIVTKAELFQKLFDEYLKKRVSHSEQWAHI